ncbi:unnamed protein product [Closterium sp. Naga37s-1]|nr:unnamed protein product [Closterium sp. Naga37s-1]
MLRVRDSPEDSSQPLIPDNRIALDAPQPPDGETGNAAGSAAGSEHNSAQAQPESPPSGATRARMPWWGAPLLCLALVAVSSAGAVTKTIRDADPVAVASWRLQASSLVLLPGFLFELIQCLLTWRNQRSRRERVVGPTAHPIGESLNEAESARILPEEDPDIPEIEQQQHLPSPPLPPPLTLFLLLLLSACALALHFALWILSLRLTSLAHSLLFVSTPPLLLALAHLVSGAPLSRAEALGTLLGGVGAAVVALGGSAGAGGGSNGAAGSLIGVGSASGAGAESSSGGIGGNGSGGGFGNGGFLGGGNDDDDAVSVQGDVAALLAAAAFVVYVWVGGRVRKSLPLHLYALPVTAAAGIMLAAAACLTPLVDPSHACPPHASTAHAAPAGTIAGTTTAGVQVPGMASWAAVVAGAEVGMASRAGARSGATWQPLAWLSPPFLAPTLFLALGPGYMGHTGLNALLRYTTPLVIAIAITVEPPLGSLIGWAIGQSGAPDAATWVGGALMVGATLWVALESERARGRQ